MDNVTCAVPTGVRRGFCYPLKEHGGCGTIRKPCRMPHASRITTANILD